MEEKGRKEDIEEGGKESKGVRNREKGKGKKQRRMKIETCKREIVGDISISARIVFDGVLLDKWIKHPMELHMCPEMPA